MNNGADTINNRHRRPTARLLRPCNTPVFRRRHSSLILDNVGADESVSNRTEVARVVAEETEKRKTEEGGKEAEKNRFVAQGGMQTSKTKTKTKTKTQKLRQGNACAVGAFAEDTGVLEERYRVPARHRNQRGATFRSISVTSGVPESEV